MITYNNRQYCLVKRKASEGELVETQIYISEDYPAGSILKVEEVITELNEIMVCPPWFKKGMKCYDIKAFLEHDDYLLLKEI